VKGEVGGALYGLYLPANWNGELVIYAHGFRPTAWPILLPDATDPTIDPRFAALRDALMEQGFALAWSSFAENGFAIQDGVIRTRQLLGLFTSKFGRPERTYLWGFSLGGAMVMQLAEQNPELFDGVLTECGLIMGLTWQFAQHFNTRALFDYYFPGVIPGSAVQFPGEVNFATQVQPQVIAAILANPAAAMQLAAVDQAELQYNNFSELIQALVTSFTFSTASWWTGDIYTRVNDKPFFDNTATQYTGSGNDVALNLGVARYAAHPSALNEISRWYTPTGRLHMPVLNLQVKRDPQVRLTTATQFATLVEKAGSSNLLLQRTVDRYGHCATTLSEEITAINDLAAWVRSGVRPAN
jgi:pimeloyl-ACP methyl ester carboxylesterase